MKTLSIIISFIALSILVNSELRAQVAINTMGTEADASAMLDVASTEKGLLIPRMTMEEREAIQNPANGLLVYQTDNTEGFYYYNYNAWNKLNSEGDSWSLKGNSGINQYQNFIGTTDENDLKFRVNNQNILTITKEGKFFNDGDKGSVCFGFYAGANDTSSSYRYNVFIGSYAGYKTNSGNQNVAIGSSSLKSNLNGKYNNSIGAYAMYKTTSGNYNCAFGREALYSNTNGIGNIATGYQALYSDTSGNYNVSTGYMSMRYGKKGDNNIALGYKTLFRSVADNNIAIGHKALYNNINGTSNIAIGPGSMSSNTKGSCQVAIGDSTLYQSGLFSDSSSNNVAVGSKALYHDRTGSYNTALGSHALNGNNDGNSNVAVGYSALYYNRQGSNQIAIGDSALYYTGRISSYVSDNNVSIGSKTLYSNTTGSNNTVVGDSSMLSNRYGSENTAQGKKALFQNYDGSNNTALGSYALYNNTNGNNNIALGRYAGNNITGSGNIAVGKQTHVANASADNQLVIGNLIYGNNMDGTGDVVSSGNIGIGVKNPTARLEINGQVKITGGNPGAGKVLQSDAGGLASWEDPVDVHDVLYDADSNTLVQVEKNSNEDKIRFDLGGTEYFVFDEGRIAVKNTGSSVFIGDNAGSSDDYTNNENVFVGNATGHSNTSGNNNTALGANALFSNSTGNNNTALGSGSLQNNTGNSNSAVGSNALRANTSGIQNIAFGFYALPANSSGYNNSAIGTSSLLNNTTGNKNTAAGSFSMNNNTTGSKNTALGEESLSDNISGDQNIAIGYSAASNLTTGSNNIVIGSDICAPSAAGNNTLNIGNLLFGNGIDGVDSTLSTGNIGIGTKNPTTKLEVNGQVKITGGNPGNGKWLKSDADGLASWETLPADVDIHDVLYDADSNTLIQVEKNSNEDKIRFEMGGVEYFVLDSGRIEVKNTGNSVFLGEEAGLNDDLTTNRNTYVGYQSGKANTHGSNNVAVGNQSLLNATSGSFNVATGFLAGKDITSGWYNIMIGYNTQPTAPTSSNQLNIGNIIYGTDISLTTPKIGIGVTNPVEKLDVLGNFQVKKPIGPVYANIESGTSGAALYLKASGSALAQVKFYDNGSYGGSIGYDNDEDRIFFYHHGNIFVKDGDLLPGIHKGSNLGLDGMAWDDIYYDDLYNQGAAAFVNRDVILEIVAHPPIAKKPGSFDAKTDNGAPELDPESLPEGLHGNNAILTDELTSYNYKTNYEQQLLINRQQKIIDKQAQTINRLQHKLSELDDLKVRLTKLEKMLNH